jgi:hypothetical protein
MRCSYADEARRYGRAAYPIGDTGHQLGNAAEPTESTWAGIANTTFAVNDAGNIADMALSR